MTIALHSYKGGTGKTLPSANLAAAVAQMGRKACLLDLNLRATNLCSFLRKKNNFRERKHTRQSEEQLIRRLGKPFQ